MYKLTKDFRFEAAHRIADGYQGKCANIHGHSWNGQIIVNCYRLDRYGFGIDFSELKKFVSITELEYDHGILLNAEDSELIDLCKKNKWKHAIFAQNPTSEVIAQVIYQRALVFIQDFKLNNKLPIMSIQLEAIVIKETCTSECRFDKTNQ